jgi:hypothetical protein
MKSIVMQFALWSICVGATGLSADSGLFRERDAISGASLEAILTSLPEVARHNLDCRKYRVVVATQGTQLLVLFTDPDKEFGRPTERPTLAGFAVNLSPDGKTVTGFQWQR